MTETQFLVALSQTTDAYKWSVENNKITGKARNGKTRGKKFDPLTAVCRYTTQTTLTSPCKAACKMGMTKTLASNITDATKAKSNRGSSQVLRGRMRQVLGI